MSLRVLIALDTLSDVFYALVYSMGTENRAPPEEFIPPQERPYDYIVFRAAEVSNLALDVDPRPEPHAAFNDPAVLSVSSQLSLLDWELLAGMSCAFCLVEETIVQESHYSNIFRVFYVLCFTDT